MLDTTLLVQYAPMFGKGLLLTAGCSAAAAAIGMLLGIPLAMALLARNGAASIPARVYVETMRGTPALLVLFLLYYGGPTIGLSLEPIVAGVVGLGFYSAAYFAEIFRGGFLSVPNGQLEAASMLGYSRLQIVTKIELPQMRALITPPITNQLIALVKDSALLSMLTIADLTKAATQMANETFVFAEPFLVIAVLYWLLNASIAQVGGIIENKARAYQ